jgi:hypothetical protein
MSTANEIEDVSKNIKKSKNKILKKVQRRMQGQHITRVWHNRIEGKTKSEQSITQDKNNTGEHSNKDLERSLEGTRRLPIDLDLCVLIIIMNCISGGKKKA